MPRLSFRRTEWRAIADELAAGRRPVPPGLAERIQALLHQIPDAWPDQSATLELDPGSVEAVRVAHAALTARQSTPAQRAAVAEATAIIRDHQRRPD